MSMAKKDLDQQEIDEKSGMLCWRCGAEIPKSDLEAAYQSDGLYLCSHCKFQSEKLEKE